MFGFSLPDKEKRRMRASLREIGNIPVRSATLEALFPHLKGKNQKVRQLERDGEVIRLKRGLYVCSAKATGVDLSAELIANHLYAPSYVSKSSALSYYGLIPEAVYTMESMTLKHSRRFDTPLGRFEYTSTDRASFPVGLRIERCVGYAFVMAGREKALCDLIAHSPGVCLRYKTDVEAYIRADIRMDWEMFLGMDPEVFAAYALVGKKPESIRTIERVLRQR